MVGFLIQETKNAANFGPCTLKNQAAPSEPRIEGALFTPVGSEESLSSMSPEQRADRQFYTLITSAYLAVFCFTGSERVLSQERKDVKEFLRDRVAI